MSVHTVKKIPINRPSITELEIAYVNDAIRNGWGERCYDYLDRFEKVFAEYSGANYALATSSCTGAIHLALIALGIKAGDEVIVPDITWIASVEPVIYIGAKPVFVDVMADSWCIDPEKFENAITSRTKAVIVVHLYGNLAEMDAIMEIAEKHSIKVLEDAAEGLGSEYKNRKTGTIGHAGVFSFHGTKTVSTGEGGIIITNENTIYERAKILNDHGRNPKDPENKMFWMREYGYKYKMSNLQAAMGLAQMERIEELIAKKRQIFYWYSDSLKDLPCKMNIEHPHTKNSYWLPTLIFDKTVIFNRELFFEYMRSNNIDCRPFFYPLSSLPMFEAKKENTVSFDIYERGINLPSFHDIRLEEIKYISELIKKYFKNYTVSG